MVCDPCGAEFAPKKPKQLSCSPSCGQKRRVARVGIEWYRHKGRMPKPRPHKTDPLYRAGYSAGWVAGRKGKQMANDKIEVGFSDGGGIGDDMEVTITLKGKPALVIDALANGLTREALQKVGDAFAAEIERRGMPAVEGL